MMKSFVAKGILAGVLLGTFSICHAEGDENAIPAKVEKSDVVTTTSGLQYRILKKGEGGKKPGPTSSVTVHYHGTLTDGTKFDSSYDRGQPATFPLNRVIKGWTEGLQLMEEGDTFEFIIPSELGYGSRGAGRSIPPNSTLVFKVELIKVNN